MPVSKFRMTLRALGLVLLTLGLLPFYLVLLPLRLGLAEGIKRVWFAAACFLCGLGVRRVGVPCREPGTFFVANHVSYLDIPVLGSMIDAAFVAKAEVAGWPVLGFLSKIAGTVFIRRSPSEALAQSKRLQRLLKNRQSLLVFPEGTSSDGHYVLPFRSSLFAAVSGQEAPECFVQPVSIAYTHYRDGDKLARGLQAFYAWFGEMELVPHLLTVLGLWGATVEVRFDEPVPAEAFRSRKTLAAYCERTVAKNLARSHAGEPRELVMESDEAILIQI